MAHRNSLFRPAFLLSRRRVVLLGISGGIILTLMLNRAPSASAQPRQVTAKITAKSSQPDWRSVAERVDRLFAQETNGSARSADDQTYLKRVFLDIVGELPTAEDVLAFSVQTDPAKRSAIVEALLADPAYGTNWGRYWRDVIMYRRTEDRAGLAVAAVEKYLTESFNNNQSWKAIARDFVTASGDVRTDGRTALIMAQAGRPEETVAEISRIFLGIQIQCAQCHDHPTDRWKREQFHQLAAFFPRVAVRPCC